MNINRVFVIVLDSYGIGHAPDAADFGDEGANTLGTIRRSKEYHTPHMEMLGLFCIDGVEPIENQPPLMGAFGRLTEASRGKDTTIGHWEIAGIISEKPLPTYPDGFPQEVLDELEKATGRGILCNKPYSGTQVIADYGEEHMKTGKLIVYTSADSVLQIAAHEDVVPLETLYDYCHRAREIMLGEHSVGRVIARPFVGTPGNFTRTPHRHDYSLEPPAQTMMDVIVENGMDTLGVGKIFDIFAGKNIQRTVSITYNVDGMEKTLEFQKEDFHGLCFVNLVDFDMLYGHRNDIEGYAKAATVFDEQLGTFLERMREDDVLFITADHGCDPGYPGTDHTREQIPVMVCGAAVKAGVNLGTGNTYANIGATVLDMLGLKGNIKGESFYDRIAKL